MHRTRFPKFADRIAETLRPVLAAADRIVQIGRPLVDVAVSGQLPDVAKQITRTIHNSMESVLILVSNGCGTDALKIGRTMFEAAVTVHYLDSHPNLVQDYIDFVWVKRKKHYDYLLRFAPSEAERLDPDTIRETEAEYERVKRRFMDAKGRVRNRWHKPDLREIARLIGGGLIYGGIYTFVSSLIHMDMLGIISGGSEDVELVPSEVNLVLALDMAVMSYAMALTAFDEIAKLGRAELVDAAFADFKSARGGLRLTLVES